MENPQFKWTAFALPFVLTFLILYGWFMILRRGCREELRNAGTIVLGNRTFELPVDPVVRIGGLIASAFIALLAAASFMSEWARFALTGLRDRTTAVSTIRSSEKV